MILSGEKKEEYREFKDFWVNRLCDQSKIYKINSYSHFKEFDTITFSNGYSKDRDQFVIELKGIEIKKGNANWGAVEGEKYFVLSLGKIL